MYWFGAVVYNIAQVSFRQGLTPERLLGRMNATMRFLVWGTMPLGGLIGGVLGDYLGVRPALWVGAIGGMFAFLPVFLSPLRTMRELPATATPRSSRRRPPARYRTRVRRSSRSPTSRRSRRPRPRQPPPVTFVGCVGSRAREVVGSAGGARTAAPPAESSRRAPGRAILSVPGVPGCMMGP